MEFKYYTELLQSCIDSYGNKMLVICFPKQLVLFSGVYNSNQAYIAIETEIAGTDMDSFKVGFLYFKI